MIRIALTFPGQGSQVAGMADGLAETPLGKRLLKTAAGAGFDLEAALGGDDDALRATDVAQPALYFTEVCLNALLPKGYELLGTAGHSVGEYAALVAAGVLDVSTGMTLVIERGRAMAKMNEGTMAAILGLDIPTAEAICQAVTTDGNTVVVANLNAPGQIVISGTLAGVAAASEQAKAQGARRVVPLNVSGAFHSPLMSDAAKELADVINAATLNDTKVPVVSNVDGKQSIRPDEIRQRLRRQLVAPVRWTDCVARLAGLGIDVIVELGPGSVLTGLAKRIAPGVDAVSASTPDAVRGLTESLGVKAR